MRKHLAAPDCHITSDGQLMARAIHFHIMLGPADAFFSRKTFSAKMLSNMRNSR